MTQGDAPAPVRVESRGAKSVPRWSWIVLVALAVLAAFALRMPRHRSHGAIRPGVPAPTFAAPLLGGGLRRSLGDYRGKVVLLSFWASWCAPCVEEMPVLDRLHRRLSGLGRPFTVLGINVEGGAISLESLQRFVAQKGVSFPVLLDDGHIASTYHVETIPFLVLVDSQGQIREAIDGMVSEKELDRLIAPLLGS